MKILIMVLSYKKSPYLELMRAQQQTFGSIKNENIDVLYYYGGDPPFTCTLSSDGIHYGWEFGFPITDAYYYMAGKFKKALEYALASSKKYDLIFRTNSSSYIQYRALLKFSETLPKEKLYAGAEIKTNEGFSIVSGAGFFLSPDTAKILLNEIDPEFEKEEDYYCGMILNKHGIEVIDDKSRIDVANYHSLECVPLDAYHYRIKSNDRLRDAETMRLLHQKIIQNA